MSMDDIENDLYNTFIAETKKARKSFLEALEEKYVKNQEYSDVIDLKTLTIVKNKGSVAKMKPSVFGKSCNYSCPQGRIALTKLKRIVKIKRRSKLVTIDDSCITETIFPTEEMMAAWDLDKTVTDDSCVLETEFPSEYLDEWESDKTETEYPSEDTDEWESEETDCSSESETEFPTENIDESESDKTVSENAGTEDESIKNSINLKKCHILLEKLNLKDVSNCTTLPDLEKTSEIEKPADKMTIKPSMKKKASFNPLAAAPSSVEGYTIPCTRSRLRVNKHRSNQNSDNIPICELSLSHSNSKSKKVDQKTSGLRSTSTRNLFPKNVSTSRECKGYPFTLNVPLDDITISQLSEEKEGRGTKKCSFLRPKALQLLPQKRNMPIKKLSHDAGSNHLLGATDCYKGLTKLPSHQESREVEIRQNRTAELTFKSVDLPMNQISKVWSSVDSPMENVFQPKEQLSSNLETEFGHKMLKVSSGNFNSDIQLRDGGNCKSSIKTTCKPNNQSVANLELQTSASGSHEGEVIQEVKNDDIFFVKKSVKTPTDILSAHGRNCSEQFLLRKNHFKSTTDLKDNLQKAANRIYKIMENEIDIEIIDQIPDGFQSSTKFLIHQTVTPSFCPQFFRNNRRLKNLRFPDNSMRGQGSTLKEIQPNNNEDTDVAQPNVFGSMIKPLPCPTIPKKEFSWKDFMKRF